MLDKQYNRIIRWVSRAKSMSADGNFSDAIMDVECARAELDDARQELLLCHQEGVERTQFPKVLLAGCGALFAVLVWAAPLHRPEPRTFIQITENVQIEARTIDGADVYSAKSTQLAEHTVTELPDDVPGNMTDTAAVVTPATLMEVKTVPVQQKSKGQVKNVRADSRRSSARLSAADMFRLTEVGRKALQKDKAILVLELN